MPESAAFPTFTDAQLGDLRAYGEERAVEAGEALFEEGDASYDFFVILEGTAEVVDRSEEGERVVATEGPGQFLGELNMLTEQAVFLLGRMQTGGRVLQIPTERLREIVAERPELSDLIVNAFIARRADLLDGAVSTLKIVGSRFSPKTLRLREFAARNQLPHTWLDVEEDNGAEALLCTFGVPPEDTPVVIWQGEDVLRGATPADLADRIGLSANIATEETYDLVVVGAGPAGLAAAVYGASEGLRTIALEAVATGGQAGSSSKIENFFGFPAGLSGTDLTSRGAVQARKFGAQLVVPAEATALHTDGGVFTIERAGGEAVMGRSVLIATGAQYRKLPLERLEDFEGAGVFYGATETEAQGCAEETVVVVGGGNSAGQAAMFLAERARRVLLLIRGDDLSASMSRYLLTRVEGTDAIEVRPHTEVQQLRGDGRLEAVVTRHNETGDEATIETPALFVFIGAEPHTGWLGGALCTDTGGFIATGGALRKSQDWALERDPLLLETNQPGVFAAGDVRAGSIKRVASAVGEGSIAVKFVHEHLGT